jgi:uncharacterized membrane protein
LPLASFHAADWLTMTQEQRKAIQKALELAIQKALDIARAAQQNYEEAVNDLVMAVPISSDVPNSCDLRGVDLRGHDVKSIVELANKMAKDEWDEFTKL